MSRIQAVILDIDGTLTDSMGVWTESDRILLERRGIVYDSSLSLALRSMHFNSAAEYIKERYLLPDPVSEILKASLERSGVPFDEKNSSEILALLKRSEGKQQFYRGLISIFGMENGVEVYKSIRPEYTNLTKLAKQ